MTCPTCGAPFDGVGSFCRQCGTRLVGPAGAPAPGYGYAAPPPGYAPPYVPMVPRVQRNLQLLSVLWVCLSVLRLAKGLIGIVFMRTWLHRGGFGHHFPFGDGGPFLSAMMPFALTTTIAMTALSLLVAYGLYQRRPWGRTAAIVISILSMVSVFPFGTGLAIFTLWVLAPAASAVEYEAIADRSRPGF